MIILTAVERLPYASLCVPYEYDKVLLRQRSVSGHPGSGTTCAADRAWRGGAEGGRGCGEGGGCGELQLRGPFFGHIVG